MLKTSAPVSDVNVQSFGLTSDGFVAASVQQRNQISKKALVKNATHLLVD